MAILSELQHAAAWGARPQPAVKIHKFTPFQNAAKTLAGFLAIELPSGLVVNDAKLMVGPNGRRWIAMPAVKQTDRDGNPRLDAKGQSTVEPDRRVSRPGGERPVPGTDPRGPAAGLIQRLSLTGTRDERRRSL